jgi:sigma-E factor negative regulatory protein RseB
MLRPTAQALLLALLLTPALVAAQASDADGLTRPALTLDPAASPAHWLQRMNTALRQRDYVGTLVYLRDGQIDALQLRHASGAGGGFRITSLSGEAIEVLDEAGSVSVTTAGRVSVMAGGTVSLPLPQARHANPQHYELVLAGQDRVAGRQSQVLDVRPRDGFRYGYRLWLDADSALLLKSVTVGPDGRPVEQLMFTVLDIDANAATAAEAPEVVAPAAAAAPSRAEWRVLDIPDGFSPQLISSGPSTHLLFSDGVARISVYIEPVSGDRPTLSGLLARGALNAFGRVAHDRQIIAMGDAPAATVERFAQGVVPAGRGQQP